ncbi:hypothetical protein [Sediminibacterium ginsengisoli]|uniref:Aspartyl protease n=1 Tax=Sediminibacterium ginsengisoli TaxID=413434 RepID=A0A1T4RDH9_9BACT|nr:hypothetical protein [Sediminibacterium ginsengisoli]SKA13788.1 hypothetical protein SAMN04488132_111128 [Sediminibacterium ginsengisoli]
MKRLILLLIISCINIFSLVAQDTLSFSWSGNYEAILVPVTVKNSGKAYYMQFDLGSPVSMIYTNAALGITGDSMHNYPLQFHGYLFQPKAIPVKKMAESNIIGTIGTDLFKDKILVIDYPNRKLVFTNTLPATFNISMHPMYFQQGRILFPAKLFGKQGVLIFDTGSSAYSLITDSATAVQKSVANSSAISSRAQSWNQVLTSYTYPSNDSVTLAGKTIPLKKISWFSGVSQAQQEPMRKLGIMGMLGNYIFLERVVVMDLKKGLWGMVKAG